MLVTSSCWDEDISDGRATLSFVVMFPHMTCEWCRFQIQMLFFSAAHAETAASSLDMFYLRWSSGPRRRELGL